MNGLDRLILFGDPPSIFTHNGTSMAEEAARMPINFWNRPDLAYYRLGDMDICRLITGTWQLDGKHGYRPFYHEVRRPIYDLVRQDGTLGEEMTFHQSNPS